MTATWPTNLPRYGDRVFDVIVVGSGSAGSTAAIAAARGGADTLLIEKLPFLGGVSTAVLDTFYGFYTPGTASRKVVGGIADDVVGALRDLGPVVERPNTFGAGTGVTYHPDHLKVVWERLVLEAGAGGLLHAVVQDVAVDEGRVEALIVAPKSGPQRLAGRTFVDASGDADLGHFAGFGYELAGELEPAQTLTTTFRVANVDLEGRRSLSKTALNALMAEASSGGAYDMPRREGSDHITPVDGMTATIMTRLESFRRDEDRVVNATDPDFLTAAEIAGRRQALEYVRFLIEQVPGYERASLATLGTQIGVRETRRVYGDYRLTRDDDLRPEGREAGLLVARDPVGQEADVLERLAPSGDLCRGQEVRIARVDHPVAVPTERFEASHDRRGHAFDRRDVVAALAPRHVVGAAARGFGHQRVQCRLRQRAAPFQVDVGDPKRRCQGLRRFQLAGELVAEPGEMAQVGVA